MGYIGVMVIVMVVMDRGTVVVLLCVSQWLLRVVSEVRHVLLVLIVRMVAFVSHRVIVVAVETAMVDWAIIEVLTVVVSVMMAVFHLVVSIVVISVVMLGDVLRLVVVGVDWQVVVHIEVVVVMVMGVHALDVMVIVVIDHHVLVVHVMDWNLVFNDMVDDLVHDWLVTDDFMVDNSPLVVSVLVVSLGSLAVCLGLVRAVMGSLGSIVVRCLVWVNEVVRTVVDAVVWGLMVDNILADNLVMANSLVLGQNIVVDRGWLVHNSVVVSIGMDVAGHVPLVELLGNLNVPFVELCSGVAHNRLVMDSSSLVVNGLTMDGLDLNVSNLWLVMSVLRYLNDSLVNWLVGCGVDRLVAWFSVARLEAWFSVVRLCN